ncbi:MAG TPA: hypothetical protein DDZ33_00255 [Clostridium sp.]|nr:hypothetical protein [Clostridium sp.]
MAIKPITISFKNNAEDKELNLWINSHSNYSGFIKDLLRKAMHGERKEDGEVIKKQVGSNDLIDLGDF